MTKIENIIERIIVNQEFRQALIERSGGTPQSEGVNPSTGMLSGLQQVQDVLAGLKVGVVGLKNRWISLFQNILPSSAREASVWRVFSVEYGRDDPLTRAIDSDANSVQLRNFVDHYQRRG